MKPTLAMLLCSLAACIDNDPVGVDDVIAKLSVLEASPIADGHSQITVEICTKDDKNRDAKLTATLKSSGGSWVVPDADPKSTTVPMSAACEDRKLSVPSDPSTLTLTATIGSFAKTAFVTLQAAPIATIRIGRQGSLSSTAASMLVITGNLDVASNGHPSLGTLVKFGVVAMGGMAYFNDPEVKLVQGDSVQSNLFATMGTTQLTVTVSATPPGGTEVMATPLTIAF